MTDIHGPVVPTPGALAALHPLPASAVRLGDGLLGGWQARNAESTLPHCVDQLRAHGNLANLRRVTGDADGEFTGMWFADTDVHKSLEAAFWSSTASGFVEEAAGLLEKAQDADGYLDSYYQDPERRDKQWAELHFSHEMYTAGHLIQAAVAAARSAPATPAAQQVIQVARKFADLLVRRFGGSREIDGHPEAETALVELYRVTGHRPYLDLAARLIDNRGHGMVAGGRFGPRNYQDHEPVRSATEVAGHVVRQLYLLAGAVDVAVETGDRELLAAAERLWDSAQDSRTYITGGQGSRHRDESYGDPYELPPDRAYAETCAAIGSFQLAWRLLLATGKVKYADEMERVLHNGIAGSTALDGRAFFYSNPLQLRTGHDGSDEDAPSQRLAWYSCACCPPNLARLMASLHAYLATGDAGGLQIHLYAAGVISHAGRTVEIATDYPWDGRITITVRTTGRWTLSLRVPAWCDDARLSVTPSATGDGYLHVDRDWQAGDRVELVLAMPPRLVTAHRRVDAVRGTAALARGPLVYCLEHADLPPSPEVVFEDLELDTTAPPVAVHHDHGITPVTLRVRLRTGDVDAIPYFLWANRRPGPMRVWIPLATPSP
ncbi:glycoside hydrolase family 127 protein [Actinoplanes sp. NPDC000266]